MSARWGTISNAPEKENVKEKEKEKEVPKKDS